MSDSSADRLWTPSTASEPGTRPEAQFLVPVERPAIQQFLAADVVYDVFERFEGGMGEVLLCARRQGSRVAIAFKSLKQELLLDREIEAAFRRECAIAVQFVGIPGILPVYGLVKSGGRPFLKMQGVLPDERNIVSLRDLIDRGPVSVSTAAFCLEAMARSLILAGERLPGLVHGDLKPENVLMLFGVPQITDFGLSAVQRADAAPTLIAGPEYAAPELAWGAPCNEAADVFSLGVMLAEMLLGRRLDFSDSRVDQSGGVRAALLGLADRCSDVDSGRRPAMRELMDSLELLAPLDGWPHPGTADPSRVSAAAAFLLRETLRERRSILDSLLDAGDYESVLVWFERIPAAHRGWAEYMYRGVALSQLGREHEAFTSYDEADRHMPGDRAAKALARENIDLQRAVSLKRTGRHGDAQAILERLVAEAGSDSIRMTAIGNLGGLLVHIGERDRARRILRDVVTGATGAHRTDIRYTALRNLGVLERDAGDPELAVSYLHRALNERLSDGQVRLILADILLFTLDHVPEAAAMFDGALAVGMTDIDVLNQRWTCAVLLADWPTAEKLSELVAALHGADQVSLSFLKVCFSAALHCRHFGRAEAALESVLPEELLAVMPAWEASWPDAPSEVTSDEPSAAIEGEVLDAVDADSVTGELDGLDLVPYLGPDAAMGFNLFVDFDRPDLFGRVTAAYREVQTVIAPGTGAPITGRPLLFTRCTVCERQVVTNRPAGAALGCRCGAESEFEPIETAELVTLRTRLAAAVTPDGERALDGWATIVAIEVPGTLPLAVDRLLEQLVERHGLQRLDPRHPGVGYAMGHVTADVHLFGYRPCVAFRWRYPAGYRGSSHVTPPPVQAFLTEVRAIFGPDLNSASFSYDSDEEGVIALIMEGRLVQAKEVLTNNPGVLEAAHSWLLLAGAALVRGDLETCLKDLANAISADDSFKPAWYLHATLLLQEEREAEALQVAEHLVELAPADPEALILLAHCRRLTGDDEGAAAAGRRAMALGAVADTPLDPVKLAGPNFTGLAHLVRNHGDSDARQILQNVLASFDDSPDAEFATAIRRLIAGEPDEAVLDGLTGRTEILTTLLLSEMRERRALLDDDTPDEAEWLGELGYFRARQGAEEGVTMMRRALKLYAGPGTELGWARIANNLSSILLRASSLDEAEDLLLRCLEIYRQLGDRLREANSISNLSEVRRMQGRAAEAGTLRVDAIAVYRDLRETTRLADALTSLGADYRVDGKYDEARAAYGEAIELHETVGNPVGRGQCLINLGILESALGDWAAAVEQAMAAAELFRGLDDHHHEVLALRTALTAQLELVAYPAAVSACRRLIELGETQFRPGFSIQDVLATLVAHLASTDSDSPTTAALADLNEGRRLQAANYLTDALHLYARALPHLRSEGLATAEFICLHSMGVIYRMRLQPERAVRSFRSGLRAVPPGSNDAMRAQGQNSIALAYCDMGRLGKAERWFRGAVNTVDAAEYKIQVLACWTEVLLAARRDRAACARWLEVRALLPAVSAAKLSRLVLDLVHEPRLRPRPHGRDTAKQHNDALTLLW